MSLLLLTALVTIGSFAAGLIGALTGLVVFAIVVAVLGVEMVRDGLLRGRA